MGAKILPSELTDWAFTEHEVAERMNYKIGTLRNKRSKGSDHPPYTKVGNSVLYPKDEFFEWAKSRPIIWEER